MPIVRNIEHFSGDTDTFEFNLDRDLTDAEISWKLYKSYEGGLLLEKDTSSGGGVIVDNGGSGKFSVNIEKNDTEDLAGVFFQQIRIDYPNGDFVTEVIGKLLIYRVKP